MKVHKLILEKDSEIVAPDIPWKTKITECEGGDGSTTIEYIPKHINLCKGGNAYRHKDFIVVKHWADGVEPNPVVFSSLLHLMYNLWEEGYEVVNNILLEEVSWLREMIQTSTDKELTSILAIEDLDSDFWDDIDSILKGLTRI